MSTAPAPLDAPWPPLLERIRAEGSVEGERILRIDHFLNHRIEPAFMAAMGQALAARLAPFGPDLVLTAEASGIAPALVTAATLGVPLVYAKKYGGSVEPPGLARLVPSPTKGGEVRLVVSARYLPTGSRVVIVDDFLAQGATALALAEIVAEAGASVVAAAFLVEKLFQGGRTPLVARGIPIVALAQVRSLAGNKADLVEAPPAE